MLLSPQNGAMMLLALNLSAPAFAWYSSPEHPSQDIRALLANADQLKKRIALEKAEKQIAEEKVHRVGRRLGQMGFKSVPSAVWFNEYWRLEQTCRDSPMLVGRASGEQLSRSRDIPYRLEAAVNVNSGDAFLSIAALGEEGRVLDHIGINPLYRDDEGFLIYKQGDISRPFNGGSAPITKVFEGNALIAYLEHFAHGTALNLCDFINRNQQVSGWTIITDHKRRADSPETMSSQ